MKRVHFIGVCGTAMATVAAMLKRQGDDVRGSDQDVYPPMSDFLAREGVRTLDGYDASHVTADLDLVVVGNAISRGNPELEEVLDRKIRYCSLPELVRDEFLWGRRSIVITGTHGKTTTTAMIAWVLTHAGRDPSLLVGGVVANFDGSYRLGGGRDFVLEGDEYDSAFFDKTAKFLKYLPDVAVVNNVEFDHADIYPDLDAVRLAFQRFVRLVPRRGYLLLGGDDRHAPALREWAHCRVETFGLGQSHEWQAYDVSGQGSGMTFRVRCRGQAFGQFELPLAGLHNVRNALAAIAVGAEVGLTARVMAEGLRAFAGVRRRLELRGTAAGVHVYDDFAHHPTAVAETLAALRLAYPGRRVWAVLEPRSASACLRVFEPEFAAALATADETIVAPVFRQTIPEERRLSPERLAAAVRERDARARSIDDIPGIVEALAREARSGDVVVLMSNGGFGGIHESLLAALRARDEAGASA